MPSAGDSAQKGNCVVNIYEAGPFEGRAEQWPVLAIAGALEVRLAETDHEVEQAQRLRYTVFYRRDERDPLARRCARRAATSTNMTMSATTFWWWTAKPMTRTASPWWSAPIG